MMTLSPPARALAAITLAFLLVTGALNQVGIGILAIFSTDLSTRGASVVISVLMLGVGGAVFALARNAATTAPEGWAQAVGQAAQLVALVGLAITVLSLLASVLQDNPMHYFAYSVG